MNRVYLVLIFLLTFKTSFAQKVEFEEVEIEYQLPPTDTLPAELVNYSFRPHTEKTSMQQENKINTLNGEAVYLNVKGWKYVDKNMHFFLDYFYDPIKISEKKLAQRKGELGQMEWVYIYTYTMPVYAKLVKVDGSVIKEFTIQDPSIERTYEIDGAYAQKRWKLVLEKGFQDPEQLKSLILKNDESIIKEIERKEARWCTEFPGFSNNASPEIVERYTSKKVLDRFQIGKASDLSKTAFDQVKIDKAFNLSKQYFEAVKKDYNNLQLQSSLLEEAVNIWTSQFEIAARETNDPFYKEMRDLLGFNMAVGLMYLNSFELSRRMAKLNFNKDEYGVGMGKSLRLQNMQKRTEKLMKMIEEKEQTAKIRGWKNLIKT